MTPFPLLNSLLDDHTREHHLERVQKICELFELILKEKPELGSTTLALSIKAALGLELNGFKKGDVSDKSIDELESMVEQLAQTNP